MKKTCGFCLAVALGVGLGRMSSGRLQQAEAGGGSSLPSCSATNGDVNTDGKVDVSDAIAVVQFLFLGEPEVLQPQCPTGLPSPLVTPGRFVDNGDGTVTDEATGLMWERDASSSPRNWQAAVSYCAQLELAGYDDWRMPDILELSVLIQFESGEAINTVFDYGGNYAGDGNFNQYWSKTADLLNLDFSKYVVDFSQQPSSKLGPRSTNGSFLVRAVRKAQ
jgi:hypothetical protein